jgi:hypothetical protein
MTSERPAGECPPHHWDVSLVRLAAGLCDHYRCVRCGAQKDIPRGRATAWSHRSGGRPARAGAPGEPGVG